MHIHLHIQIIYAYVIWYEYFFEYYRWYIYIYMCIYKYIYIYIFVYAHICILPLQLISRWIIHKLFATTKSTINRSSDYSEYDPINVYCSWYYDELSWPHLPTIPSNHQNPHLRGSKWYYFDGFLTFIYHMFHLIKHI